MTPEEFKKEIVELKAVIESIPIRFYNLTYDNGNSLEVDFEVRDLMVSVDSTTYNIMSVIHNMTYRYIENYLES